MGARDGNNNQSRIAIYAKSTCERYDCLIDITFVDNFFAREIVTANGAFRRWSSGYDWTSAIHIDRVYQ